MIRTAAKGMMARKLRTILTSLAIVIGVGMVSAAYILTDTWQGAADKLSTAAYDNVGAVVTTKAAFDVSSDASGGKRPPFPESVLADVRGVPEVGVAVGDVSDQVRLVGADGKAIGGDGGAPSFAEGVDTRTPGATALSPFELKSGRFPSGPGEVAIDAATAKKEHLAVGERIGVSAHGSAERFRIVGTATFGSVESIGGATAAIFELHQAQALTGKTGKVDSILVGARAGVSDAELRHAIAPVLPHGLTVESAQDDDRFGLDGLKEGLGIFQKILVGFGFVALFVGGFVIFNTLAITVAQRSRDFALLRTIGASRRQVLGSVVRRIGRALSRPARRHRRALRRGRAPLRRGAGDARADALPVDGRPHLPPARANAADARPRRGPRPRREAAGPRGRDRDRAGDDAPVTRGGGAREAELRLCMVGRRGPRSKIAARHSARTWRASSTTSAAPTRSTSKRRARRPTS